MDEALIFLHIPKTAGTTLNRIIEWQYSLLAIFRMGPDRIRATPETEDYIRLIPHRQNLQCRLIAGIGNGEGCDERALDTAAETLTR